MNSLGGGGAEKTIQTLTNHWVRSGAVSAVSILCTDSTESVYPLEDGITLRLLPWARWSGGLGSLLSVPLQAMALARILKKEAPLACVSFLPRSNFVHILSRCFGNRLPVIVTEHTSSFAYYGSVTSWAKRQTAKVIRLLYPRSDLVIAASTSIGLSLVEAGLSRAKLRVIPNPVELRDTSPEAPGRRANRDRIVTIGRLSPEKDHKTLIQAFARVKEALPGATLTIVGEGPERKALERLIASLALESSIFLVGWQADPFPILLESDVFVLTSTSEGFGVVLVEAMVAGLPIISTNCPGGPAEILGDGEYGILVPVGSSEGVATGLMNMLTHDELFQTYRLRSLERARRYSVEDVAPEYFRALVP